MSEKKYIIDNANLIVEWDWEKNNDIGLDPSKLTCGSNKKAWWICNKNHSWEARIDHRARGQKCPICSNKKILIGENDLQTLFPNIAAEWDSTLNGKLTPNKILAFSAESAWWKCPVCNHQWQTQIRTRTKERQSGCPQCAIKKRSTKRLKTYLSKNGCIADPLLLSEWNFGKNGSALPQNFTQSSNKKVWWKCSTCSYEWEAKISNRNFGRGCPCCSNKVVVKGKNDLATTKPDLASEWHPTQNYPLTPNDVTIGCGKKVWWRCPIGHEYQASIVHRGQGTNCPICNAGRQTSFAEQAIFYYIQKFYPDAINRCQSILGNRMELDIYIPSLRLAIEYDGAFWHKSSKSKEREKTKYDLCHKKQIALWRIKEGEPNIIDRHPSQLTGEAVAYSSIKANFVFFADPTGQNKNLNKLICDLLYYMKKLRPSLVSAPIQELYNSFDVDILRDEQHIRSYMFPLSKNSLEIKFPTLAKEWHPSKNGNITPAMVTPGSSKRVWWKCSKCDFEWQTSIGHRTKGTGCPQCYNASDKRKQVQQRKIYQYSLDNVFIKEWNCILDAGKTLSINASNISMCARHKRKQAGGFKWEYEMLK